MLALLASGNPLPALAALGVVGTPLVLMGVAMYFALRNIDIGDDS